MMDMDMRILELGNQGYECSQILMMLGMEMADMENPDLIRAMSGLNSGMGRCGKTCGCLTAGACVLGLFTGKGEEEEIEDSHAREYIQEYVRWFEEEIGASHGGCQCEQIIHGDYSSCIVTCGPILTACLGKLADMLEDIL